MTAAAEPTGLRGHRVVLVLYAVTVAVATLGGYLVGVVVGPRLPRPVYLGVLALPATPAGLAVWGAATVGTVLGMGLVALVVVSRRYARE